MRQRVAVLTDQTIETRPGGATRLLSILLGACPPTIEPFIVTPNDDPSAISNAEGVFTYLVKQFSDEAYSRVLMHENHIRWDIDWWPDEDGNAQWRGPLTEHAKIVVYDSPLHRDRFLKLYKLNPQHVEIVPCPMDVAGIMAQRKPDSERKGVVWAGEWHIYKGPDLAMRWAADNKTNVDFYSPSMPPNAEQPQYCTFRGFIPENEWYSTLAGYEKFLHFPRVPDAFPYSVLEAYALGLEVEVRGRLGVESFGVDWDDLLGQCETSAHRFWELVEETLR